MYKYNSLTHALQSASEKKGILFIKSDKEEHYVSYTKLYHQALVLLHHLQKHHIGYKDEMIIQMDDHEEFVTAFWACILGGIIPIPVSVAANEESKLKLLRIWSILDHPHMITNKKHLESLYKYCDEEGRPASKELERHTIVYDELEEKDVYGCLHEASLDDIAFIQFSSGSTGNPKGVMLTHENLLANAEGIIHGADITEKDHALCWMPLTHDMGLIGFHITNIVAGANQYTMAPTLFIRHCTLWMSKTSEHRCTVLYSPNFGYKHFLKFYNKKQASQWDLSCVRVIFNGAEPISSALCHNFLEELSAYQLPPEAMFTVYGLAEASVGVSFPPVGEHFITYSLDRNHLNTYEKVQDIGTGHSDAVTFVDVGSSIKHCQMKIGDAEGRTLEDDTIGYIFIKGKNVTKGYYNNEEATRDVFVHDNWLNTGDFGFMRQGRLVITGRAKEIIFVNGQNFYPHDIDRLAEKVEGIELGKIASCGVYNQKSEKEEIVLFVLYKKKLAKFVDLAMRLKTAIGHELGIEVNHVVPVKRIPKTTSGKVQRYKLMKAYQQGEHTSLVEELKTLMIKRLKETQEHTERVHRELAHIWKNILDVNEVHQEDHFFHMGGHSILTVQLVTAIYHAFRVHIQVETLRDKPTFGELSQYIGDLCIGK